MTASSSDDILNLTDAFSYIDRHRHDLLDRPLDYIRCPNWSAMHLLNCLTMLKGSHEGYGEPGHKTVLPHEAFVKCDMHLWSRLTQNRSGRLW